jgi:hypothetical protein
MNQLTHTQLHTMAVEVLAEINRINEAIRKNQDRCVLIEKGNEYTGSLKRDFIAEFHSIIADLRKVKAANVNQYAEIMRRLNEPIVNRMMMVDGDGISEVVVTQTIESNLLK